MSHDGRLRSALDGRASSRDAMIGGHQAPSNS